jgi:hypothetical protein
MCPGPSYVPVCVGGGVLVPPVCLCVLVVESWSLLCACVCWWWSMALPYACVDYQPEPRSLSSIDE